MNKQEKIVCAAVKVSIVKDGYEGSRVVKGIDYKSIHQDGLLSEITHPTYCNVFISGFITNKNRFIDAKEAMQIAIKSGQYPDYELMKKKDLENIEFSKENAKHNESIGVLGFKLYVADISEIEGRIKELDKLLERNYLLPEDLY